MKKILLIVMLLIPFLQNVHAETIKGSFYSAEKIANIYVKKVKGDTVGYRQARFIRNAEDDSIAYCIEPFEIMKENKNYTGYDSNNNTGLSESVWKKISLIAYYGYGYANHTADKWYAITQHMIWQEIDKNADFFFTDGLDGPRINIFESEIQEIKNLVNSHYKLPSFAGSNYVFSINSSNEIEDNNKVLEGFTIKNSNENISINKSGNKLTVDTNDSIESTISFEKKFNNYNKKTFVFVDDSYQNIMTPGNLDSLNFSIKISVKGGSLKITKVDADTMEKKELGEGKIIGSIYEIIDSDNSVIDTLTINDNFEAETSKLLPFGKYILKEKESMNGYLLDSNEYPIEINSSNLNVELILKNQVIKSKIEMYKYYGEKLEKDISFDIYDSKNNLIDTVTTDEFGKIEKELFYGKYRFHQLNTTKNYLFVDDFEVIVDENSDNVIRLNIYDKKFSTKLVITKTDSKGKTITTSETIFKIYDVLNNKFILINNNPNLKTVNGILTINSIEAGEYEIEEVKSPSGYKKLKNRIKFIIDEDNEFSYDENLYPIYNINIENEEIIVKVPNTLVEYPSINIIRIYLKKEISIFC